MTAALVEFSRGIPKAELHVHLEGTISPSLLRQIAERNGLPAPDAARAFACSDFPSFLRAFLSVVATLRAPRDFADIALDYLRRSARDNVRHVELMFSPATQRKFVPDLDLDMMTAAVAEACLSAEKTYGITSVLIIDMVRNLGEPDAFKDIELALRHRHHAVVGVGLGGDERNFPARDFAGAFARARAEGLRRTAHAGEAAGAFSIRDAVTLLDAERLGHGVAAQGETELQALLLERGVAIDVCPSSNRVTGAVGAGGMHPLKEFVRNGITTTLNSDDPAFFGATVGDEYEAAARSGFDARDINTLARNSFSASFLNSAEKERRLSEVERYVEEFGAELGMTR